MCTTTTTTTTPAAAVDPIIYAAALAAVKREIEAHSAVLERAVADTRAALLAATRATVRSALPVGHILQPLADLVADSLTIGEDRANPIKIPAPVADLVSRADECSPHKVDALRLWAIRPRVGAEERAYLLAMERMAGQVARVQGS
jgi:hypothetical protein